ncbi:MAG TPA: cytochrome c biogenesis protein CcdA [Vicinamibacterales bacterium]|nr:cytochrome c biogenesis protein CcdA [Vicinamibacterales bacterium]
MRLLRLLPPVVLALAALGLAQGPGPATLQLTPLVESDAAAGGTVRLALQIAVPDGLHIQSNAPRDPALIPTALTIDAPAGFAVTGIAFPDSIDFSMPGFDQPLAVFEHTIAVGVVMTVPAGQAAANVAIPAHLRYQACDATQCFPPRTVETSWTLHVVPAGASVAKTHQDVFGAIAFDRAVAPPAPVATSTASAAAPSPAASGSAAAAPATASDADVAALLDDFTVLNKEGSGGYMNAADFLTFVHNAENGVKSAGPFEGRGPLAILAIIFIGGLALNLTPCVLPMIPINLAIIGAGAGSDKRGRGLWLGAVYGGAMAIVYGLLGLVVVLTAGTFGTINASPWFNVGIAALFVVLALAMFDVIPIDFSRYSSGIRFNPNSRGTSLLAFGMGAVAALLAGACVAPVVIQVIVFSSNLYAGGTKVALALPFVLGLGMALPWPIAGAGFSALPKPGAWMVRVKQVLGVFILVMAGYYGYVAYGIFANRMVDPGSVSASVASKVKEGWHASLAEGLTVARTEQTPVLVDFWATWCKNCLVMDETTMEDAGVKAALAKYTRIKVQAEDPDRVPAPVKRLMNEIGAVGLPAYAILQPKPPTETSARR